MWSVMNGRAPIYTPQFAGGTVPNATTFTDTLTINKTAEASSAETVADFGLGAGTGDTGDTTSRVLIENGSTTDNVFRPTVRGTSASNRVGLTIIGQSTTDSSTEPVLRFYSRIGASTAVSTRPLVSWLNGITEVLSFLPLNSGANLALSWGTQADSAPSTAARSIGTRIITSARFSAGTLVDTAIGARATGAVQWYSVPDATSSYAHEFYGGATLKHTLRGDGLADHVGTVRATGATAPTTGTGVEMLYSGGGIIGAFNRSGSVRTAMTVQGLTVTLNTTGGDALVADSTTTTIKAAGTTVATASTTALTMALPLGLKSYTVATLPSAATAGQLIYVSNESGGACVAFSDGTNWRRISDRAIVS